MLYVVFAVPSNPTHFALTRFVSELAVRMRKTMSPIPDFVHSIVSQVVEEDPLSKACEVKVPSGAYSKTVEGPSICNSIELCLVARTTEVPSKKMLFTFPPISVPERKIGTEGVVTFNKISSSFGLET